MLNMYQLWLDDLYPRAKFADALAIIEKVGHTKRMQVDRRAWIDEGKPRRTLEHDEDDLDVSMPDEDVAQDQVAHVEGLEATGNATRVLAGSPMPVQPPLHMQSAAEEPDEDELDALLAGSEQPAEAAPKAQPSQIGPAQDDPFADEMEAMEDMEDMW